MLVSIPAAHPELVLIVLVAVLMAAVVGLSLTLRAIGSNAWRAGGDYGSHGAASFSEPDLLAREAAVE